MQNSQPSWGARLALFEHHSRVLGSHRQCAHCAAAVSRPASGNASASVHLIRKNSPVKQGVCGEWPPGTQIFSHFVFWEKSVGMSSPNLLLSHPPGLLLLDPQPRAKPLCTTHKAVHILSLAHSLSMQMDNDMDYAKLCRLGGLLCPNVLQGTNSIQHRYRSLPTHQ